MNQSLFSVVLLVCVVTVVAHVTLNISENQEYKSNQINDESIYYFGKSGIQINDGSCYVNHFKCLNNPNDMIQQFTALTPYDCCKSCLNNTKCVAYNHLYINATTTTQYIINDHPQCQLFSTFPNDTDHVYSGNCVMGTPYDKSSYAQRPNFVFYFPDTIRMESMSIYDHPLPTTPNIKQFAQRGITFNNHITQHSQCSPSRNAMITGRYMHVSGHRTQTNLVQYWEPNYLRWLKDSGYYILWLGKNDALSRDSFPLSVNEWHDARGVCSGSNAYSYPQPGYFSFLSTGCDAYGNDTAANGDYKAVKLAQTFLQSNPPQPFFIFIPGIGAHPPYGAPRDYHTKFDPMEVKQKAPLRPPYVDGKPKYHSRSNGIPYWRNLTGFDDDLFYKINAIYLGRVNYMDWIFGELMSAIDEFDKANDKTTGVVMSSDHGDFAGDYHLVEKWPGAADDMLIRIPLIMRVPRGKVNVTMNVSTANLDILHTLADLAQIDVEFVSFGESLREQILDGKEGYLKRIVYSEGGFAANQVFPNGSDHISSPRNLYWPRGQEEMSDNGDGSPKWVAMRNTFYKLVFRPFGVSELYDLQKDPRQLMNVWNSNDDGYRNIQMQWMAKLTAWFVETGDVTPILMDSRGIPKQVPN
eukprot:211359_1